MNRTYVRIPTRRDTPATGEIYGKIGGNETIPDNSVGPLAGDLTNTHVEDVVAVIDSTQDRRLIAGEYLTRARDDFDRAARTRVEYIVNARRYGMTLADIGALLGVTEGAVRYIVKQYGGDA